MTLNPITVVDHVLEEYRSYLSTELQARDSRLREALEAALDAGVGSPLELRFLRLFEQHGLAVEKQVPVSVDSTSGAISQADFRVAGTRVLIYVDGSAFHKGARLRRDRAIRERLRGCALGWRVVEVRAPDLKRGGELADWIRSQADFT